MASGVWAGTKTFAEVLKQKELEKLAPPPPAVPANQPETAASAAADASGDAKKGKRGSGGRDGKKGGKKDEPVVVDSTELEKLSLASVGANADVQQSVSQVPVVSAPPSPPRPSPHPVFQLKYPFCPQLAVCCLWLSWRPGTK
jgi:hypothetical protein